MPWALPLIEDKEHRYKVAYGGRFGSKTEHFALAALALCSVQELRFAVVRERMNSIKETVHSTFKRLIGNPFMAAEWTPYRNEFRCRTTGSTIFFMGLSDVTMGSFKGLDYVKYVWVDEAQDISRASWEYLDPSIRAPNAEVWASMNPRYRPDPFYHDFVTHSHPKAWVHRITYLDNPLCPQVGIDMAEHCKRIMPERYAHIWLGEPDDEGSAFKLIPYAWLDACLKLFALRSEISSTPHIGCDVAAGGQNRSALAVRAGPALDAVTQWSSDTQETADRVHAEALACGAAFAAFDAGGVGAGVTAALERKRRPYHAEAVFAQGKVVNPWDELAPEQRMGETFRHVNGQLAFNLRRRALNSHMRLTKYGNVPLQDCLLINPEMPGLEELLAQLAQPEWYEDGSGFTRVEKQPKGTESPDAYDAVALAYYHDLEDGSFRMPQGFF